jgi:hypothetical protein
MDRIRRRGRVGDRGRSVRRARMGLHKLTPEVNLASIHSVPFPLRPFPYPASQPPKNIYYRLHPMGFFCLLVHACQTSPTLSTPLHPQCSCRRLEFYHTYYSVRTKRGRWRVCIGVSCCARWMWDEWVIWMSEMGRRESVGTPHTRLAGQRRQLELAASGS